MESWVCSPQPETPHQPPVVVVDSTGVVVLSLSPGSSSQAATANVSETTIAPIAKGDLSLFMFTSWL